jgi:hypothetical protein
VSISITDWRESFRGRALDPTALALRLTLATLLLRPVGIGWLKYTVVALAVIGLVSPKALRHAMLWWLLAALAAVRVIADWPMADNHAYLLCYWLLAIALCRSSVELDDTLARNARLLIGLTFAFASLWKVLLSPDYLDGTFFLVTMATDVRFENFTRLAAGLDPAELQTLRDYLHAGGPIIGAGEPTRYRAVAMIATGWNVFINLGLACAFLGLAWIARLRNAILIVYCAVTYAVATVDGFAWILISMGVAQTDRVQMRTIGGFVAAFLLVLGYREWG